MYTCVQVVVRSREFRRMSRHESIREYFYGKKSHRLDPFSVDVKFSDVEIFKIGGEHQTWMHCSTVPMHHA